jgi:general secretion pathway protein M
MNALLTRLRDQWAARSQREQLMLAAMAAVLILIGGWYGVAVPLGKAAEASEQSARIAAGRLAQLETAARSGNVSPGALAAEARQPLQGVVDAAAQASGVTIDRRREEEDGRLTVWVAGLDPATLMTWLTTLARVHGVAVTEVTASRIEGGLLEAQITLARPAA